MSRKALKLLTNSELKYSIIIPNFNGVQLIESCINSIANQSLPPHEVIVVDDGSQDNSVQIIRERYPWVKLIVRESNGGFATACNDGFDAAQGDVLVLFNNDAEADVKWLEAVNKAFVEHPEIAMVASKIMLYDCPNVFHSAGDYCRTDGIPGNRGFWEKDLGQYDLPEEIFGPCGAAAAYRRSALDEVRTDNLNGKILDETLFMYMEDVDLNLRLQLRGRRCLYVPTALVRHRVGATAGGKLTNYQCGRNLPLIAIKNLPSGILIPNLPFIILLQIVICIKSLRHLNSENERARLRGQWASLLAIPHTLRQRSQVQSHRQTNVSYLKNVLWYNLLYKRLYHAPGPKYRRL